MFSIPKVGPKVGCESAGSLAFSAGESTGSLGFSVGESAGSLASTDSCDSGLNVVA